MKRLHLELELALGKWLGGNVEFVRHDLWQTHLAGFSLRKSLLEETHSSSKTPCTRHDAQAPATRHDAPAPAQSL